MSKFPKMVKGLERKKTDSAPWEILLLALVLVTFFGVMDRTKDKELATPRTAFQTKRDLYDIKFEERRNFASVETGL